MRSAVSLATMLVGVLGLALLAVGITYLILECQALPGFLGPTPGDTSPRHGLGVAGLLSGVAVLAVVVVGTRRRHRR